MEVDYVAVLLGEGLEPEPWFFYTCFYGFGTGREVVSVGVEFVFLLKLQASGHSDHLRWEGDVPLES